MTRTVDKQDIRSQRGPFNALIVKAMRRDGIKEITKWADHWGIGRTTLHALVRGREAKSGGWMKPSLDTLVLLARALEKPLHELVYIIEPDAPGAELLRAQASQVTAHVRELPVQVAGWCGAGPDQDEELDECVYVEESFVRGRDLVAFKIRGDSMEAPPRPIYSGDIVLVDRADKGYDTASVVARLVNDGYVCKLLKDDRFGFNLYSANARYTNGTPPHICQEDIAEIVGRVVRVIHDEDAAN